MSKQNVDFWSGKYKLSFSDLINMFNTQPIVAVLNDGTDVLVQENGYTLEECISMYRSGASFYIDNEKDSTLPAWLDKVSRNIKM